MSEWLHPFRGRRRSAHYDVNLLWRSERLYVMDNHRVAMWCWLQHLSESKRWNLFHIDYHFDTLAADLDAWLEHLPPERATLETYLEARYEPHGISCPVVRWDNYLAIFLATHRRRLGELLFATGGVGDRPKCRVTELDPWHMVKSLEDIAAEDDPYDQNPWIVNIDLDYFTAQGSASRGFTQVFGDAFIGRIGEAVARGLRADRMCCVTIALSPETTGGWPAAERLLGVLLEPWGSKPELPKDDGPPNNAMNQPNRGATVSGSGAPVESPC